MIMDGSPIGAELPLDKALAEPRSAHHSAISTAARTIYGRESDTAFHVIVTRLEGLRKKRRRRDVKPNVCAYRTPRAPGGRTTCTPPTRPVSWNFESGYPALRTLTHNSPRIANSVRGQGAAGLPGGQEPADRHGLAACGGIVPTRRSKPARSSPIPRRQAPQRRRA